MPIFATSWILTFFAHDIECFDSVQSLYDVILSSHPLIIVYFAVAMLKLYQEELEENAEEYQSSVCFFVFKAPLNRLNSPEEIHKLIQIALECEESLPISVLLDRAEQEEGIIVTKREKSPFRQMYAGQLLGFDEGVQELEVRQAQVDHFDEKNKLREEIEQRAAEINDQKRLEALNLGIDAD